MNGIHMQYLIVVVNAGIVQSEIVVKELPQKGREQ
jgi:hypothetical protein